MRNINLLTIGVISLLVGAAIGYGVGTNKQAVVKLSSTPSPSPSPNLSYYENLLKEDKEVMIKRPNPVDLTGDNKSEAIYITADEGCASCHDQTIRIFDDQKEIFNEVSDDPLFVPGDKAFMVFQPVRKENEPLCCPTSFSLTTYLWDGQTFNEQSK